ncbi:MAG: hypothetical protein JW913_14925 [Chitinispirillaceae bacterium]|nr:hypothetical protein [Chitinispirillaceae bacterium]
MKSILFMPIFIVFTSLVPANAESTQELAESINKFNRDLREPTSELIEEFSNRLLSSNKQEREEAIFYLGWLNDSSTESTDLPDEVKNNIEQYIEKHAIVGSLVSLLEKFGVTSSLSLRIKGIRQGIANNDGCRILDHLSAIHLLAQKGETLPEEFKELLLTTKWYDYICSKGCCGGSDVLWKAEKIAKERYSKNNLRD